MIEKSKKKLDKKEINTQISDLRKELLNLRFQKNNGQLQNTSQFKIVRKKISRLLTASQNIKGSSNA